MALSQISGTTGITDATITSIKLADFAAAVDLNGVELILDADQDTSISADTDDTIDIKIGGADDFQFTANTFTALAGSSVVIPDGGLTLASTAVTSTAAEINLIDGGTARGTTALASGDGILINDGGTMAMTNVDTVKTFMQAGLSSEGTGILSTGETAGTKFLREDGDNSCSWQSAPSPSNVTSNAFDFGNWTITETLGVLYFATSGVNKMKLDASGNLTCVGNVTAYGTM